MSKKTTHIFLLLHLLLFTIASCEKLEEPTKQDSQPININEDTIIAPITLPENPDSLLIEDIIDYVENYGSTEETAYSVYDVLHIIPQYLDYNEASGIPNCFVDGFIVGYIPKNNISRTIFSCGDVETNIVIADRPDEVDYHNCIAIQLSTNTKGQTEVREGLNLFTHPENLRQFVILHGNITKYMGTLGLKSVNDAVLYTE